jgi:hypothetical protein
MLKQRLTNILHGNRPTNKKFLITFGVALLLAGFLIGINFNNYTPGYEAENETEYLAGENETYSPAGYAEVTVFAEAEDEPYSEEYDSPDAPVIDAQAEIPIPLNMRESMRRRTEKGLLPYSDSLEELRTLIFPSAVYETHTFSANVPAITINAARDNVRVTQGGDEISIRYGKWLEGHYIITTDRTGHINIDYSVPYFKGFGTVDFSGFFGNAFFHEGTIIFDGWLFQYLIDTGREPIGTIEITIPEGMTPLLIINSTGGDVIINDVELGNIQINTTGGDVNFENAVINRATVNISVGNYEIRGTRFTNMNVALSTGTARVHLAENVERYNINASTSMSAIILGAQLPLGA